MCIGNGIDDDDNGYVDDVYGYDFVNDDGDPMDDDLTESHGTFCAGIVGATANNGVGIAGAAKNVGYFVPCGAVFVQLS